MEPLNKSAASDASSELRQRKGYVWVYWCLARRATGRREDDDASLVLQAVLQQEKEYALKRLEPENADDEYYGYSAERESFWLRPNRIDEAILNTGATSPSLAFYESRPTGREVRAALMEFVGSREFELWSDGKLQTSSRLSEAQRKALKDIVGDHCRLDWAYEGVLLLGQAIDAGIVWFGIRGDERLATLPSTDQAARLRRPGGFVRVAEVPAVRKLPSETPLTEDAAHQLVAAVVHDDVKRADEIESDSDVWFFRTPQELVAVSTLPEIHAETEVYRRTQKLSPNTRLLLLGREQVDAALARWPWLWSKYQGPRDVVVLAPKDWDGLLSVLRPAPFPDYPLIESSPASRIAALGSGATVVLHGRIGMGKTIALYQLARKFRPDDLFVVVRPNATAEHRAWLSDLFVTTEKNVTCILDDLDEDNAEWLPFLVRERARHLREQEPFITVLTAYSREETRHVRARYWRELQDFDAFNIHDSDVVIRAAVRATTLKSGTRLARERLDEVAVPGWQPSIRQLIEATPDLNDPEFSWPGKRGWLPPTTEQRQCWTHKFLRLRQELGSTDQVAMLILLRVFYLVEGFFISEPRNAQARVFTVFGCVVAEKARATAAWEALQDEWLLPREECGIAHVDPCDAGVFDQDLRPTPLVRDLLRCFMRGVGGYEWREVTLDRLAERIPDTIQNRPLRKDLLAALVKQLKDRREKDPTSWMPRVDDDVLASAEKRLTAMA